MRQQKAGQRDTSITYLLLFSSFFSSFCVCFVSISSSSVQITRLLINDSLSCYYRFASPFSTFCAGGGQLPGPLSSLFLLLSVKQPMEVSHVRIHATTFLPMTSLQLNTKSFCFMFFSISFPFHFQSYFQKTS